MIERASRGLEPTGIARWYLRTDGAWRGRTTRDSSFCTLRASGLDADSTIVKDEAGGDWLDASSVEAGFPSAKDD